MIKAIMVLRVSSLAITVITLARSGPREAARPLLERLASTVAYVGEAVGDGQALKLVNQLLAGVHIAAAEQLYLAGAAEGLGRRDDSSLVTLYERWAGRPVSAR